MTLSQNSEIQPNLGITTTEGTGSKWSYFSGGLICQVWFKIFQYGVVHYDGPSRALAMTSAIGGSHVVVSGDVLATTMTSGACKRDDRSFAVPTKEKLDKLKSAFRSIWRMWSLFSGWIDALGRPLVSSIRISQVVAFSRTLSVHLNPRIEGTEIVCPQFSGGRFCQVVARTGSTVEKGVHWVFEVCFTFFFSVFCIQTRMIESWRLKCELLCSFQNLRERGAFKWK